MILRFFFFIFAKINSYNVNSKKTSTLFLIRHSQFIDFNVKNRNYVVGLGIKNKFFKCQLGCVL